jgi:hypothetical protein
MEFLNESTIAASDSLSSIIFQHTPNSTQTIAKHPLHMVAINPNRLTVNASTSKVASVDTTAARAITDISFIKLLS